MKQQWVILHGGVRTKPSRPNPNSGDQHRHEQEAGGKGQSEQPEVRRERVRNSAVGRLRGRFRPFPKVERVGCNGWTRKQHGKVLMRFLPCAKPSRASLRSLCPAAGRRSLGLLSACCAEGRFVAPIGRRYEQLNGPFGRHCLAEIPALADRTAERQYRLVGGLVL